MRRPVWRSGNTAVLAGVLALCGTLLAGPTAGATEPAAAGIGRTAQTAAPRHASQLPLSEAQFARMFPERNAFYTYDGFVEAARAYPQFAHTGSRTVRAQELAAFLAHVGHETGGLYYTVAQDESTYPNFCDDTQPYGCPAGTDAYYGRGAFMLSWNFNYQAAGEALGLDLLHQPWLVEQDPKVAWATALWYWNTQTGPGTHTGHQAIVTGKGFGETIRSLNGTAECADGAPEQMRHRVELYLRHSVLLHTAPGRHLTC